MQTPQPKLSESLAKEINIREFKLEIDADFTDPDTKLEDYFVQNDMSDDLDQAGNDNEPNRRWSLHYNPEDFSDVAEIVPDKGLVMRLKAVQEDDPKRKAYTDKQGNEIRWHKTKVQGAWLDSVQRTKWLPDVMNGKGGKINDPASPCIVIGKNTYIEFKVNFENMKAKAGRNSGWLMPWEEEEINPETGVPNWVGNQAYTKDKNTGVEIDMWEIDAANLLRIMQKVVGGKYVGDTPNGAVDFKGIFGEDYDIFKGNHVIGLAWIVNAEEEKLVFSLDGYTTNIDRDRVPHTMHRMILSEEGNSGVKDGGDPERYVQAEELIPADPGLWPPANLYNDIDKFDEHEGVIKRWRVWSFDGGIVRQYKKSSDMSEKNESPNKVVEKQKKEKDKKKVKTCPHCGGAL